MQNSPEQIIEAICPELSGSPSLQVYLGMAVERTDRGFFGKLYNQALAYRAAHIFTVMATSGDAGVLGKIRDLGGGAPVASMSEGGLSISLAQSASGLEGEALGSTKYGRLLLGRLKTRPRGGVNQLGSFGI
jgi:hypothetical protein